MGELLDSKSNVFPFLFVFFFPNRQVNEIPFEKAVEMMQNGVTRYNAKGKAPSYHPTIVKN